jgi:hypothetical protein
VSSLVGLAPDGLPVGLASPASAPVALPKDLSGVGGPNAF